MKKFSRIYKVGNMRFRYNYEIHMLEYIAKAGKQELEDNKEWQEKYGRDLWEIGPDGYEVIDRSGLMLENWKESPRYWCERYAEELNEECACEIAMDKELLGL